jgi:hypothetical protein
MLWMGCIAQIMTAGNHLEYDKLSIKRKVSVEAESLQMSL